MCSNVPLCCGVPCQPPCPHSANSQMPNKGIISSSHDIIFPFTQCLNGTLYGFLSHLSFPPSLHLFLSLTLSVAFPQPSLLDYLSPCPLCLCFFFPILFLLYSSLTLTLQRVFALKSLLLLFLSFSFSLSLSGGKSHTHQFAGSVPDEQACKENINEAPQPINT